MSIITRRSGILRARSSDELSLQMLQVGQFGAAFDQIAGGKLLVPTFNPQSTLGNPNDVGANCMFGSGQAIMGAEGNIFDFASAGTNPTITGTGVIMAVCTLPANSLDTAGRGLNISAFGSMANGTATRCQIYWNTGAGAVVGGTGLGGGTLIADTTSASAGGAFALSCFVFKYGNGVLVAGSGLVGTPANTQVAAHQQAQIGSTVFPLVVPTLLTATETGVITISVVGTTASGGAGVGNLVLNLVQITAAN
jgi:hypothetical protein